MQLADSGIVHYCLVPGSVIITQYYTLQCLLFIFPPTPGSSTLFSIVIINGTYVNIYHLSLTYYVGVANLGKNQPSIGAQPTQNIEHVLFNFYYSSFIHEAVQLLFRVKIILKTRFLGKFIFPFYWTGAWKELSYIWKHVWVNVIQYLLFE